MTIGEIDIGERPVLLAPMEDVTDASFRGICREQGADMVYTEFIPSEGLIRDAKKAYAKLKTSDDEAPVGIQIYGSDPDAMVEAARMADHADELVGGHGCDVIDINFGCPVSKIAGRGAGSGMMKDPDKMVMITKRIVEAVGKPVTVNGVAIDETSYIRSGVDPSSFAFSEKVTAGHVFVMGDNRANSADSRYHQDDGDRGLVPISDVVGVGIAKYWPLDRLGAIDDHHEVFKDVPEGSAD